MPTTLDEALAWLLRQLRAAQDGGGGSLFRLELDGRPAALGDLTAARQAREALLLDRAPFRREGLEAAQLMAPSGRLRRLARPVGKRFSGLASAHVWRREEGPRLGSHAEPHIVPALRLRRR